MLEPIVLSIHSAKLYTEEMKIIEDLLVDTEIE